MYGRPKSEWIKTSTSWKDFKMKCGLCSNSVLILKRTKNIFPYTDIKCSGHLAVPEAQEKRLVSVFRCSGKDTPRVNIILPLLISRTTVQSLQTTSLAFLIFPKYLPESSDCTVYLFYLAFREHIYWRFSKQSALGINIIHGKLQELLPPSSRKAGRFLSFPEITKHISDRAKNKMHLSCLSLP